MKGTLPLDIYRLILTRFPQKLLEELRTDHELISKGWHLHFAVDHRLISQFCFPIEVERLSQYQERELEIMSCEQNALYELFFNTEWKSIVLASYYKELAGLRNFIMKTANVYRSDQIIARFVEEVGLQKEDLETRDNQEVIELCKRKLSSVLAIALSIHSIGAVRFDRVVSSRLAFNEIQDDTLTSSQSAFEGFRRSSCFGIIYDLMAGFDARWKVQYTRDADAIDKVIQKNHDLLANKRNVLVLFISSASNVKRVFEDKAVEEMMPMVRGRRYGILRTPEHFFSYLLTKGSGDTRELRAQSTLANIREVQRIQQDVAKTALDLKDLAESGACQTCKSEPVRMADCRFRDICDGLEAYGDKLEGSRQEFFNTGLVRAMDEWAPDLKRLPPSRADKYDHYVRFIIDVQSNKKALMLRELRMLLDLAAKKARFASEVPVALASPRWQFGPRSRATCVLQHLPIRPRIKTPAMLEVLELIVVSLTQEGRCRLQSLSRMLGKYMECDALLRDDPESEVLRCIIYLVFEEEAFFEVSSNLACAMATAFPDFSREFKYVASFAARLLCKYEDAIRMCDKEIVKDPTDPRLHHSRSIAIYCWKEDESRGPECKYTYKDAMESALRALRGYSEQNDKEMMAVNYNNVAYLSSLPTSDVYDLARAKQYFRLLTKAISKDKWDPAFPEFFDTEACVLLARASQKKGTRHISVALKVARAALRAEQQAIKIYNKKLYRDRLAAISRLIEELGGTTR